MCEALIGRSEGLVNLQRGVPCRGLTSRRVVWARGYRGAFEGSACRGRYMDWDGAEASGGWTAS
jgi:hypothetical protein